ncbi:hypothetical protein F7734_29480 [Scytonema sp. UIC 10036]|uniref:hypothetical protein n=1 Tax=Scytonema sp. UIC 10036 TaxID=2304196 RepID=UPI0012DA1299|nr:hypothetical protein [Scytonema sp. UIC 10036]MUG96251.1 hypothetical protein [Scytonema sp. UIC 10036]
MLRAWIRYLLVPVGVAFIGAVATLGAALIQTSNKTSSEAMSSATVTCTNSSKSTCSECNKITTNQVYVDCVSVQINNDEPKSVRYKERVPLRAGDNLRVVNLRYCISPEATVNLLEGKAYLFKKSLESYEYGLSTTSSFPLSRGCHYVGNFEKSWQVESGQHRVVIPMILYDGSNKVVDKNFYFNLDVGP